VQISVWKLWFKKKNQSWSYLHHLVPSFLSYSWKQIYRRTQINEALK